MRSHLCGSALALSIALLCSFPAPAQTKKSSAAPAASAPFDPHHLLGAWMQDHPRLNTVDARYWVYKFTLEEPTVIAWGEQQFKAAKTSFGPHAYG